MKKVLALLALMLVFVLAFAACGNGESATPEPEATETPQETPVEPPPENDPTPPDYNDEDPGYVPADGAPDFHADQHGFLDYHFPAIDLGGITLRVQGFGRPDHYNPVYAARYSAALAYVEEKFNVTLDMTANDLPSIVDWSDVPSHIIETVAAGDPVVHLFGNANAGSWFVPIARQGALVEMGDWVRQNFPPTWFENGGMYQGRIYGFSFRTDYSWVTWGYNRELIRAIGMEMTPSEMFKAGRWSYDDFYDYLTELNNLLPADSFPFVHRDVAVSNTRQLAAGMGTSVLAPITNVPRFTEEAFLEPIRFMTRIVQSGLHPQATFNEEHASPHWSFALGNPPFMDHWQSGQIAIMNLAPWDFGAMDFEWGIVPPPWPNQVNFPASGNWRDIRIENPGLFLSTSHDNAVNYMVVGTPSIVTPEVYRNIWFSYHASLGYDYVVAMQRVANGEPEVARAGGRGDIWGPDELEMHDWIASEPLWDQSGQVGGVYTLDLQIAILEAVATGADPRPLLEAQLGQVTWNLLDRQSVLPENLTDEMRALAEEFGATMGD